MTVTRFQSTLRARWGNATPLDVVPRGEWPAALRHARTFGLVLIGLQFLGLCIFGSLEVSRVSLTDDFSHYEQAVYLISHGMLNPTITAGPPTGSPIAFWRDHGSFIYWPLAFLRYVWPHQDWLKWLQAAALAGASLVALGWLCDIAAILERKTADLWLAAGLVITGALMLALSPEAVATQAYDFHGEALSALFLVGTAREIHRGRDVRAYCWLACGVLSADVTASYLVALGCTAILSGRCHLRAGVVVTCVSVVWLVFLSAIHGAQGTNVAIYPFVAPGATGPTAVLTGAVGQPEVALRALRSNLHNIWANVSPTGVIGWLWPPVLLVSALVLVQGALSYQGLIYAVPGQQNVALFPVDAVGFVGIVAWVATRIRGRGRRVILALIGAAAANAVAWGAVWLPGLPGAFLRTPSATSHEIKAARSKLTGDDQVIASYEVVGAFSDRRADYSLAQLPASFDVAPGTVSVVLTAIPRDPPWRQLVAREAALWFSKQPGWRQIVRDNRDNVWVFAKTFSKPTTLTLDPSTSLPLSAFAGFSADPRVVTTADGQRALVSNRRRGNVLQGDVWATTSRTADVRVALRVSKAATIQVYDTDTGALLAIRHVAATHGRVSVDVPVSFSGVETGRGDGNVVGSSFGGWGPWSSLPTPSAVHDIEVRVGSPGGRRAAIQIYGVAFSG
jgi:Predicted membrane protein (DUF2079)